VPTIEAISFLKMLPRTPEKKALRNMERSFLGSSGKFQRTIENNKEKEAILCIVIF
jgi:hypothetical protein